MLVNKYLTECDISMCRPCVDVFVCALRERRLISVWRPYSADKTDALCVYVKTDECVYVRQMICF